MPANAPFFQRSATRKAIKSLGECDDLSLFLGAGVSAESALPPWQSLIERVLRKVATELEVQQDQIDAFVQALVSQHGLLTAAAIAQSAVGRTATLQAVRAALYDRVNYAPRPGFHAQTIADLVIQQLASGRRTSIVTTNYDRLVESAIASRIVSYDALNPDDPLSLRPVSVVSARDVPSDCLPVFHIHGCVAPEGDSETSGDFIGDSGGIVLGERDYAQLQTSGTHWQDDVVAKLLDSDDMCLFTGMSLADPNIIRYLTAPRPANRKGERYALVCTQSERNWVSKLHPHVAERYDEAVRRRITALDVKSVTADYFIQVPQFLSEVLLYRAHVDDWAPELEYEARLRRWRKEMTQAVIPTGNDVPDFAATQTILNRELARILERVDDLVLDDDVEKHASERLSLELWYRNPRSPDRSLELWGSSVQMWSSYGDLAKPPISYDSQYTAVQAFMRGGGQFRRNGRSGSRWQFQLSLPIRLAHDPWFNLPVGSIVLSSSLPQSESCLAKLRQPARRKVEELILSAGVKLCDPIEASKLIELHHP